MTQKLNNVKCRWASVIEPNTTFDPVYEIEAILDNEQAAVLRDQGLAVKEKEGELIYRFKRKVEGQKKGGGTFLYPKPIVVGKDNRPFEELIGNGSTVNIAYDVRKWEAYGGSGVKGDLVGVQVIDHVAFTGGGGSNPFGAVEEETIDNSSPF
jgi:hypothetical protein